MDVADHIVAVLLPDPEAPESVRCERLPDATYIIRDVPVFSNRFGFADVITASVVSETLTAQRIVESAGWSTYALEPSGETFPEAAWLSLKRAERLGVPVQLRAGRIVSVAVPSRIHGEVLDILRSGEESGLWRVSVIREAEKLAASVPS